MFPSIPFSCTPEPLDEIQLTVELKVGDGKVACSFDVFLQMTFLVFEILLLATFKPKGYVFKARIGALWCPRYNTALWSLVIVYRYTYSEHDSLTPLYNGRPKLRFCPM